MLIVLSISIIIFNSRETITGATIKEDKENKKLECIEINDKRYCLIGRVNVSSGETIELDLDDKKPKKEK